MLVHTYTDAFLKQRVSKPVENQAIADVAIYGAFPQEWHDRLVVIRAYILACVENLANDEDTFSTKLKHYQIMWNEALQQARAAQGGGGAVSFIVPIERG